MIACLDDGSDFGFVRAQVLFFQEDGQVSKFLDFAIASALSAFTRRNCADFVFDVEDVVVELAVLFLLSVSELALEFNCCSSGFRQTFEFGSVDTCCGWRGGLEGTFS